ncbi:permease [Croceivirga thetidis]|uniref:Permease n=1 Tax=Croceivirga thetidis TaxID=2721623 RepID=A0ABX1GN82_9FLAO|nr:permease [Croceivirga thetidis]NKI31387.1 permease [Croceivirga thetidis]
MEVGFEKTLVFLIFILLGIVLKTKFKSKQEVNGIKKIILNLALPATIFIALLGIKIEASLLLLPLMALVFNLLLFAISPFLLPIVGVKKNTPAYRTAGLLIPSLAPGLSCFPFVLEFLGKDYLAKAAMADLGNKVFVLIVLYMVAMHWFYARNQESRTGGKAKLMSLLKTLVTEPVNLFIGAALILLVFGFNMESLPFVISDSLAKLSLMMTPLVLLFIGLAVKIKRQQFAQILSLLLLRAGLVFLISAVFVLVSGISVQSEILLMISFGLSACSFWPFAHLSLVDGLEVEKKSKTFDSNYAVAILALSFPLSTVLILGVLNSGAAFGSPFNIFITGVLLSALGAVFPLVKVLSKKASKLRLTSTKMETAATERA